MPAFKLLQIEDASTFYVSARLMRQAAWTPAKLGGYTPLCGCGPAIIPVDTAVCRALTSPRGQQPTYCPFPPSTARSDIVIINRGPRYASVGCLTTAKMVKAEVGSTKWLGNKMKAKGLQRLRWYCQVCERQMRDANGFKQHTLSEGHVRQMQIVGQDANKFINDYSNQFKSDFVSLLRTSHGEKKVNINHFYNEYIANKEHVHMNATKWPTLTEFAKYLGREAICRVDEGERGLEISWVDTSPEALRRQAAIQKKERQDKGDEEREQRLIQAQIERAKRDAAAKHDSESEAAPVPTELQREGDEKIKLSFASTKATAEPVATPFRKATGSPSQDNTMPESGETTNATPDPSKAGGTDFDKAEPAQGEDAPPPQPAKFSFSSANKPKNVFAAKKNAFSAVKPAAKAKPDRPMSEAERIMREELDQKRRREERGAQDGQRKRMRL